uniref:Sortilin N-terminal domain-containing protein n=1 Tax=Solibacter usitatus (strain Ellin6076) TaxID=234267 RepID=Q01PB5_SOLUE
MSQIYMTKILLLLCAALATSFAQPIDPDLYAGIQWRLVGPLRAGKATSASGIPGNPAVYYFGTAGSGVWKTNDGGQTWACVSDPVRLTGIGAVAVAPSRPDTLYVGASGTGPTAGLYRSTDAGDHWELVALQGHAVASIVIDPRNSDLVMAAAGDTGVLRTSDGGKTWNAVLPDSKLGAVWLVFDPDDPRNVYAGTRPAGAGGFGGGGGRGAPPVTTPATDSQVYRSGDEGLTWVKTSPDGLPGGNFGTISLAVAPGTKGQRVYDYVAQGLFRSDDGGAHWSRATDDPRLIGGGQFHDVIVDPRNPNILFATQTSLYRSIDAGKTWESYTGAPSGADFNYLWIDPTDDRYMILATDQGAGVSMNAGRTWTSWYNQPTGQMYNVTTDHGIPFFLYSAQQDSGTIATPIFGRGGQITYRDWYTTNGFETARIVPDAADPNYLYATGWYGSILRINKITGQTQHVFERTAKYRENGSPPMGFAPADPKTFYLATQFLLATRDKGMTWQAVSPDLTATNAGDAAAPEGGRGGRGGEPAISGLAFSPKDAKEIWAGTSNGHLQLSRDGGAHWSNVASAEMAQGGAVATVEASPSDPARAFALVGPSGGGGRGATAATPPRIYRTDDYGQSWKLMNNGLPNSAAHAVREDPGDRNLVFAALDSGVFVSFNGGGDWQSLELNLPAASCRDLAIEQNHLIVATFGRALWSIDDLNPLRELAAKSAQVASSNAYLFAPAPAVRMQWDTYTDTPLSPELPATANPPDGAVIDYYLKSAPAGEIKLEIYDPAGKLVRSYSSTGAASLDYKVNVPDYWLAPASVLPKTAGLHRFVWDLRYPDPEQLLYTYYGVHVDYFEYTLADHAIPHNTPWHEPQGPMVLPGQYEVRLTAGGQTLRQPITVTLDPRLQVSQQELRQQLELAQKIAAAMSVTYQGYNQGMQLRADLASRLASLKQLGKSPETVSAAETLDGKVQTLANAAGPPAGLGPMNRDLTRLMIGVGQSETPPAEMLTEAFDGLCHDTKAALARWKELLTAELPKLNALLAEQGIPPLTAPRAIADGYCGN